MEGLNVYERMKGKWSTYANAEWMFGTVGMNKTSVESHPFLQFDV
jgi:hypothetical protein